MSRLVIFDKLPAGSHTYYENAATGAIVDVQPGDRIPASAIVNPDQYIERGLASIEGVEDGSDGKLDRLMAGMRAVFADVAPLSGPSYRWTLEDMFAAAKTASDADSASRDAFTKAEAERHAAEKAAQDEAGGGTPEVKAD